LVAHFQYIDQLVFKSSDHFGCALRKRQTNVTKGDRFSTTNESALLAFSAAIIPQTEIILDKTIPMTATQLAKSATEADLEAEIHAVIAKAFP
jgi:hypothetical protein